MSEKMRKPKVSNEDFVVAWQRGESIDAVAKALGCHVSGVRGRANRLRKAGVPLKEFPRGRQRIDVQALKALALRTVNDMARESEKSRARPAIAGR